MEPSAVEVAVMRTVDPTAALALTVTLPEESTVATEALPLLQVTA